ncbi:MAG TPA: sulfurtransferase [Geobacterales bacterium]|nr:sulfurtransferase [Geobacterales bacterium]
MSEAKFREYAYPDVLVSTDWVANHLNDSSIRIVEVDYDPVSNYFVGHIPNAVLFDWKKDMNHPVVRDILTKEQLEELLSRNGISNDTTIILYGDYNNWFAAFSFWILKYYGVEKVKLMDGGRKKWILENRPLTKEIPSFPRATFKAKDPDDTLRAYMDYVRQVLKMKDHVLVDVRSPKEYTGEILAPPEYPDEKAQRGGHIPGAINIPWSLAVREEDGTFKTRKELEELYKSRGVTPDKEIITYCRIGERSSITWFVLKYLLGYQNVKNYDGSWSEWGSVIRNPIEK